MKDWLSWLYRINPINYVRLVLSLDVVVCLLAIPTVGVLGPHD